MIQHSARTRYYVHGDHHEKTPNMYYCARCDLFEPAQHFEDVEHVSTRAQRYEQSLQSWERYAKKRNSKLYRPPDAENIIAELAAADVRAEKAARSQFYRWILRQTKRDDPIGDFASDVERDQSFPRKSNSLEHIRIYLLHRNAAPEAIVAFDEACTEFKAKGKVRSGISVTQRFAIFKRDSYRCCICGASANEGSRLEVDHKIAVAKGGTNGEDNLWTLCFECNRGKGTHDL
jgi:5-methylcytosine-specific restriction endonuclease McrA